MKTKIALLIGATGLTGEQCLRELLASAHYSRVVVLVRSTKKLSVLSHEKLQVLEVDFERLEDYKEQIKADHVYCAIGTTIAKAGSQEAFRKVDYEYPLQIAQIALWNGAQKFILVSSIGASASSGVFYSRVKGELEEALKALNYGTLVIFRPSILLGNRKENRAGEKIGIWVAEKLSFLFIGPLKAYRGTPVNVLAKQMVKAANGTRTGYRIIENNEILST